MEPALNFHISRANSLFEAPHMSQHVLITGGAGFIGSHLADELLAHGYTVRALDNLTGQVHGPGAGRPDYLSKDVELLVGDVRSPDDVRKALKGVDAVVHFAARVGVGQSMYEILEYVDTGETGTAVLLQELITQPVAKLLVASSMSLYGEGLYLDASGNPVAPPNRSHSQMEKGLWLPMDASGRPLTPCPTPETKPPNIASIYALNKFAQERMCLIFGDAYNVHAVALRFFNVYGTRQALSNPYTGVLAIFAARLLNDNPPLIFEDGGQKRDFIHVKDTVRACRLALETPGAAGEVINIGAGSAYSIKEVAERFAAVLGKRIEPQITHKFRFGDIRNCYADITKARAILGFEAQVDFEKGLAELANSIAGEKVADNFDLAFSELRSRGLTA
jgi:dTDP-L-rhamnose 4-epimerase